MCYVQYETFQNRKQIHVKAGKCYYFHAHRSQAKTRKKWLAWTYQSLVQNHVHREVFGRLCSSREGLKEKKWASKYRFCILWLPHCCCWLCFSSVPSKLVSKCLAKASSRIRALLPGQGHPQHCENRHCSPHHPRGRRPTPPRLPARPALPWGGCGPGGALPSAPHPLGTARAGRQGSSPGAGSRSSRSQTAASPCQGTSTCSWALGQLPQHQLPPGHAARVPLAPLAKAWLVLMGRAAQGQGWCFT